MANYFSLSSIFLKVMVFGSTITAIDSFETPTVINIGGILTNHKYGDTLLKAVQEVNMHSILPSTITLNATYVIMEENPIKAAKSICKNLIPRKVNVVIASHNVKSKVSPMVVSFTCGFYRIPVIDVSTRESSFSDKNVHTSFMRTVAPYSHQTEVWVKMVDYFKWKSVVLIHSSDEEGRAVLARFQTATEDSDIKMEYNLQFMSGKSNFAMEFKKVALLQSRVILLYAEGEDAAKIFAEAEYLNMTGVGYVWLVSEDAFDLPNTPTGSLAVVQDMIHNQDYHIADAVEVIASGFSYILNGSNNISLAPPPDRCSNDPNSFVSGPVILRVLMNQELVSGKTGLVSFDENGDRATPTYSILNCMQNETRIVGMVDVDGKLNIQEKDIEWPGNEIQRPKGIKISTHLQVITLVELPFVFAEKLVDGGKCLANLSSVPCPKLNVKTGEDEMFCCIGYAVDLLIRLAKSVNFTYDLRLATNPMYGSYERHNGEKKKSWSGMIGDLVSGRADLIVAPLTIDPERAEHIDFSKPFKYQGLTILVKKTTKDSSLASFLQPFHNTLWILVGLSVHVVALVLYLLDRFSPFGRFKLAKSDDTEEDALNLSSAMWFAWGVLLNSGIGEGTPRSFSARVLGMVWAGFAMIIVASYTANLAAFLVLDRPEASISGIDDARLRNPQEDFMYATVKNSAVSMYFKRQVELSTMYRTMEERNYDSADTAIQEVKAQRLQAFIWDSSRLEYEAANDCDLVTAGELFGRSGYGIGLRKGSPWTHEISLAILGFHEKGEMEQLDGRWILVKDNKCPEKDTSPATLGLTNMAGVFMMVAGGILGGVFIIFIEIAYKRHRGLKEKELELAKNAADRWRANIEKRRTLRHTLMLQQQEKLEAAQKQPGGIVSSSDPSQV